MSTPEAKVGLVVSLVAKPDKVSDLENFLLKGYELAKKEPETLQWFAVKYPTIENQYAIIDTFAAHKGRVAHLEGPIAAALMEHAPTLLGSQPDIMQAEVLASHIKTSNPTDLKVGLRVFVTAKEGMEEEVKDFLLSAVPLAKGEPFTPFWLAIAIPGTRMFGVIDFFASDEKREQHLGGKIAEALFANAERLLAGAPDVAKVDVVAWKVDGLSRPEPKKQCCYSAYR